MTTRRLPASAARSRLLWVLPVLIVAVLSLAILAGQIGKTGDGDVMPTRQSAIPQGAVKVSPSMDQYPPILSSGAWHEPVPLPSAVNTAGGEDSPFILPDGQTLYFFFTPNVTAPAGAQLLDKVTGIYASRMVNGTWSEASRVVLQDQGKQALDGCPCVQGSEMWFCSARTGYAEVEMFTASYSGGSWCCWSYAGDLLNINYTIGEVHLTADGQRLYFHAEREGGKGGLDIWVTERINGTWQQPVNVEAVNTDENEGYPFISQDGGELWFTRTYLGTPAIFRSALVNGTWSEPEMIVHQFAGEPTLDSAGNLYFVHHFYSNGSMVEADIYVAYRK